MDSAAGRLHDEGLCESGQDRAADDRCQWRAFYQFFHPFLSSATAVLSPVNCRPRILGVTPTLSHPPHSPASNVQRYPRRLLVSSPTLQASPTFNHTLTTRLGIIRLPRCITSIDPLTFCLPSGRIATSFRACLRRFGSRSHGKAFTLVHPTESAWLGPADSGRHYRPLQRLNAPLLPPIHPCLKCPLPTSQLVPPLLSPPASPALALCQISPHL